MRFSRTTLAALLAGALTVGTFSGVLAQDKPSKPAPTQKGGQKDTAGTSNPEEVFKKVRVLLRRNKLDEAEKLLKDTLKVHPNDEQLIAQLSEVCYVTGRKDEAEKVLLEATSGDKATPLLFLRLSNLYEREKQPDKATESLKQGSKRFPKEADLVARIAQVNSNNDRLSEEYYLAALKIDPKHRTSLNNLAAVYMDQNKFNEALQHLETYVKHHSGSASGSFNLASTYYSLGRIDDGFKIYEEMLERRPGDPFVSIGIALGNLYRGNAEEAIKLLSPVTQSPNPNPLVLSALGRAYLFTGKPNEAYEVLSKAYKKAPNKAFTVTAYAESMRQQNKLNEAQQTLKRYKKISKSGLPYAQIYHALVLHGLKKPAEAKKELETGIKAFPTYTKPEDLQFLTRMPKGAIEDVKTILAHQPETQKTTPEPAKTPEKASGCSCSTPSAPVQTGTWTFMLLLGAFLWVRRGRRRAKES